MRRILFSFFLLLSVAVSAQENGEDQFSIEGFVNRQLQTYPKLRLLDIYKSCFQDYMGAEKTNSSMPLSVVPTIENKK